MKKKTPQPPASTQKFLASVDAHAESTAGRTPEIARHALLAQPVQVAGLTVHPPSLATQILLEEIDHPILKAAAAKSEEEAAAAAAKFGARDVLTLIYIFTNPADAWRTMGYSKENFHAAARDFAMGTPPQVVAEIVPVIQRMLTTANRAVPGATHTGSGAADPLA